MARLKARGITFDTDIARKELQNLSKEAAEDIEGRIRNRLESLLDSLNENSTFRGYGDFGEYYDQPLASARVRVKVNKKTQRIVYVHHRNARGINIFDVLDQGIKPRYSNDGKPMRFPTYEGNLTREESFGIGEVEMNFRKWASRSYVRGFYGRNYYKIVADSVRKLLRSTGFYSKTLRQFVKLKRGEVSIRTVDRNF